MTREDSQTSRRAGGLPPATSRPAADPRAAPHDPLIAPVDPARRPAACELLVARLEQSLRRRQADALLEALDRRRVPPDGLLGAWRGERLVGAVLAQLQAGKTAVVWMPGLIPEEPGSTARELLEAATNWLERQGTCVAQVMLESVNDSARASLESAGFAYLVDLLYLVCLPTAFPRTEPASPLRYETYSPRNHDRFARVVEATYRQSLDCPALDGVRHVEDVLEGYREASDFDPELWRLAVYEGRDVGCLLLADHPEMGNCELVYMGVAPSQRGRRWGLALTRVAQWVARRRQRERLVLAVDRQNQPALNIYAEAGFEAWDRRTVFARIFRCDAAR